MATRHEITKQERETLWKMDDAYITSVDKQIRIGQNLARFSPMASYVYSSTTLAQTGIPDYVEYRQRVSKWIRENIRKGVRPWPKFAHRTFSLSQGFFEIHIDLLGLLLWNVLLFMGANLAFLRYDAR